MNGADSAGLRYSRAPFGARFGAWFVDGIIASPFLSVGMLLFVAGLVRGEFSVFGLLLLVVGGLWSTAYSLGRDAISGAGFGKQLAGLVVVSYDAGAPVTGGPTVVRQLILWATNLLPGIGSLIEPVLTLVDSEGRRLGDKFAKTQVVQMGEVEGRGYPVTRNKTMAIVVLVAAILISLVGSTIGSVVLARSIYGAAGGYTHSEFESILDPEWGGEAVDPEPGVGAESPAPSDGSDAAAALTEASAIDAVGNFLYARQNGEPGTASSYATAYFQSEYDWFFDGTGPIQFEVVETFEDAALYVVVVREEWPSGPENLYYFVTIEDGKVLVSDVAWEDQL